MKNRQKKKKPLEQSNIGVKPLEGFLKNEVKGIEFFINQPIY